jgi:FtsH-binding integral membrane protein
MTVLTAAILTAVMVTSLTAYACFSEIDYTKLAPYLFMASLVLFAASLIGMFIKIPLVHLIISAVTVIFFGVYLIVDTQMIIGGKTFEISMDDYVLAAMMLYIDIVTIFVEILKILGNK